MVIMSNQSVEFIEINLFELFRYFVGVFVTPVSFVRNYLENHFGYIMPLLRAENENFRFCSCLLFICSILWPLSPNT